MKIGWSVQGGTWKAGAIYFFDLMYALKSEFMSEVELYAFLSGIDERLPDDLRQLGVTEVRQQTGSSRTLTLPWLREKIRMKGAGPDLTRIKTDILFGHVIQHRYRTVPTLSWIPDFQHKHLPEMFDSAERLIRDRAFLRTARVSTRIVLMSETARRDFSLFFQDFAYKATVLRPVSRPPQNVYELDPKSISDKYRLPAKFFYYPGHFWKHKNHELVFEALKLLKDKGCDIFLVCDGYPGDYRHPRHFTELLEKISQWGLGRQVAFLESFLREEIFALMRQSVCVTSASLFEGFGLTVDEAASLGKRILLSDIPAHREQTPPASTFFDPHDPGDLADKMNEIWKQAYPGPDSDLEQRARHKLPERIHESAQSIMSVIRELIG